MATFRPVQVFGLQVPPGEEPVPAFPNGDFPATFRVTMAAIDPTIGKEEYAQVNGSPAFTGATLRILRVPDDSDDEDDDDESLDMADLVASGSEDGSSEDDDEDEDEDDEDEEDDDDEVNGGPSDPSKSPKAKREAARQTFKEALALDGHDMEVDDDEEEDVGSKLTAKQKGKAKAIDMEDMDSDDEDELEAGQGVEELVLCTLDLSKNYQQPLDITVNEHETVYFQASGTHTIYLTGNVLIPEDLTNSIYDSDEDDEEDYDLPPDEDELDLPEDEDESDELDDLEDPRISAIDSDEDEEVPKLVKLAGAPKAKNKRAHEDSDDDEPENKASLDDIISKSLKPATAGAEAQVNGEQKLSKNQMKKMRKKLKDNAGNAVEATMTNGKEDIGEEVKSDPSTSGSGKPDKKVQFAKTLVQGPSSSSEANKSDEAQPKTNGDVKPASKSILGPKVIQGVTIDDKKLGTGPAAKKGDKVSMRYIGKLEEDKKVFDSNKKGKPFQFNLGASQVIRGWDIGVQGMCVGGERRITIPAPLAYGSKGAGKDIPPNSTLVFDVKLLNIS